LLVRDFHRLLILLLIFGWTARKFINKG
jgi:hypothetical protein